MIVARLADSKTRQQPEMAAQTAAGDKLSAPRQLGARAPWRLAALPLLAVALLVALVFATAYGAVSIPPLTSAAILLNQTHVIHIQPTWPASDEAILLLYRLPRVAGAALVGAALGVAGVLFQGLLRNPLADPLLLGTSSGAALGATVAFLLPAAFTAYWLGFGLVAILAFVGALLSVAMVYLLATRNRRTPVVTLLLAGVAVGAILTAAQTLLITMNDRLGLRLLSLYRWISGSINVESLTQALVVAALVVAGIIASILLAPALDAFALGEEMAGHLGMRVERYKLAIVFVATMLVGAAVSISGIVGFVGLVAPHLCRLTLGPRHRLLVPTTALAGAIFVVVADVLARVLVAPGELPLGVLTALVGGPFFLWLLRAAGSRYRW